MIYAVLALALAGLGFAGTATALGIRNGGLRAQIATLKKDLASAEQLYEIAEEELTDSRIRLENIIADHKRRLRLLNGELDKCGDDVTRGRIAVDGIRRLGVLTGAPRDATVVDNPTPDRAPTKI